MNRMIINFFIKIKAFLSKAKEKKRKSFSLIEMFAAITLMLIISTAMIVNFKESFNKGKAFRSKEGCQQVHRALIMSAFEDNMSYEDVVENWECIVEESPLVSKKTSSNDPLKDGWDSKYIVEVDDENISVRSTKYEEYINKSKTTKYAALERYWE